MLGSMLYRIVFFLFGAFIALVAVPQASAIHIGSPTDPCRPFYGHGYCTDYVKTWFKDRGISIVWSGDAIVWIDAAGRANASGWRTGVEAREGAIVVFNLSAAGHVALVKSVSWDHRTFTVTQMNYKKGETKPRADAPIGCYVTNFFGVITEDVWSMTDTRIKGFIYPLGFRSPKASTLLPVDEAGKIPAFLQFRTALLQAIDRRDAEYLIRVLDKDIKLSFGGDWGVQRFIEMWNPRSPQSTIWRELGDVLRLGGTFGYASYPRDTFWAPYVFGLSGQLANFWDAVIVGNNVPVHAQPSSSSPVIAALSYDVVKLGPYDPNPITEKIAEFSYPWKRVQLAGQRTGYVYGRYVRSPIDYRAAFNKVGGAWKLTLFLQGD